MKRAAVVTELRLEGFDPSLFWMQLRLFVFRVESFGKRQEVLPRVLSIAFTELFDAFATERRLLKNVVGRKVDFRGWSGGFSI